MRLQAIAEALGCQLEGDPDVDITGVAPLAEAKSGDLSFISDPKYLPLLEQTQAGAVIVSTQWIQPISSFRLNTLYTSDNPRYLFAKAIELFYVPAQPIGIHPTAWIHPEAELGIDIGIGAYVVIEAGAKIGNHTRIHAHSVIGSQVEIGQHCQLFAHCVIHERTVVGDYCVIHSGAVIGDDGFGHIPRPDGSWYRMLQSGRVVLEEGVDIGSNSTVDRPAVGETRIGKGTKIDNLVQIGHGVQTGSYCLLVSQSGIAGGTRLGQGVILGGQVGIAGHIEIGDHVTAVGRSGITNSVEPGKTVAGFPAQSRHEWQRLVAAQHRLPTLLKTIRKLEQRIQDLESKLDNSDSKPPEKGSG
jgi:UDP-3-O-[3-hydroxymyristoyl] glucosamine N-acyltransferase